jgi:hypothetical protein
LDRRYHVKQWPLRGETFLGQKNVAHGALVEKTKIYLPTLHLKLGLIKMFLKATNKEGEGFEYLGQKCPSIREANVKEGIVVGPKGKQLLKHPDFKNKLNAADKRVWDAFENVCSNSLGNKK